jgi:hypothetical protein
VSREEAAVIENELREVLPTFLVSTYEDSRLIQTMIEKVKARQGGRC